MKLLLIAPDMSDVGNVKGYFDVWSHYLPREFKRLGVDFRLEPLYENGEIKDFGKYFRELELEGIDHILAIGLRYFSMLPIEAVSSLSARFAGAIAQYNDAPLDETPVDCTFTARRFPDPKPKNVYCGWAADPDRCKPEQDPEDLQILIDHPDYSEGKEHLDRSIAVIADVDRFIKSKIWYPRFQRVRVRRLIDGGVEDCDLKGRKVSAFTRQHIPFPEICKEYCKTHIFLPTHEESLGLTVLETSLAGAMTVSQVRMIPEDRLEGLRNIRYELKIDWRQVLDELDAKRSRQLAMKNSWRAVAVRMLSYFQAFER